MSEQVLMTTEGLFPDLKLFKRGKVRDIYEVDYDTLLFVATDRISAFDRVLPNGIPYKGKVLNQISAYWFNNTLDVHPNHMLESDVDEFPEILRPHTELLRGRSMLVQKTESLPVKCVERGYLAGSAWKEYQATGSVCGIKLKDGLVQSQKLPHAIFTPATKAASGHDINISFKQMIDVLADWQRNRTKRGLVDILTYATKPRNLAGRIRAESFQLYDVATLETKPRGIIIADTKFEFGVTNTGQLLVIDEMLTPDSSRFWPTDDYEPGRPQKSFDKQFVRDWLESEDADWDKNSPPPELPEEVVQKTSEKYLEAYRKIVGRELH